MHQFLVRAFVWAVLCAGILTGCCGPECQMKKAQALFTGGGEDAIMSDLPFAAGYTSKCTQGAHGSISHNATSTMYDVDLDTPNDVDDPVYAPVGGVAYTHTAHPDLNFGNHINLDLGDGTYVIMGHMKDIFVDNGSEVAAGQLLGFEGTTGNSSGDHVHLGRHRGDASLDGIYGVSFDGLELNMLDLSTGEHVNELTTAMTCDLVNGTRYESLLPVSHWHPDGSLLKTPDNATIYLVEHGQLTPFITESSFLTRNYDFSEVALMSYEEMACYNENVGLDTDSSVTAVYGAGSNAGVWLLIGPDTDPGRYRLKVPSVGWQAVLKSWGIIAATFDDLYHDVDAGGLVNNYVYAGTASFRDGSLVSPVGDSAVYVMSDGVAMPIDTWDTLLFSGWEDRTILEVADSEFEAVVTVKGDCGTNTYCYTQLDAASCSGPDLGSEGVEPETTWTTSGTFDDTTTVTPPDGSLTLTWSTPNNALVDSITLAGAVTHPGLPESPWGSVFNEVLNANAIGVTVPALSSGDSLRFSVEFRDNGIPSWSCLAPYPPGIVQGTVTANYGATVLAATPADDPGSDGCGLSILVP